VVSAKWLGTTALKSARATVVALRKFWPLLVLEQACPTFCTWKATFCHRLTVGHNWWQWCNWACHEWKVRQTKWYWYPSITTTQQRIVFLHWVFCIENNWCCCKTGNGNISMSIPPDCCQLLSGNDQEVFWRAMPAGRLMQVHLPWVIWINTDSWWATFHFRPS